MFSNDTRMILENIITGVIVEGQKNYRAATISYAYALAQVQQLKKTLNVNEQLKKGR
jgi:hypothetical protein